MEGRCLFKDGDIKKPDSQVSQILKSSSLWDLILFKTIISLKKNQGFINQLLSAIDIIHISLGSLLHECLIPMEVTDLHTDEDAKCIVLHADLARIIGFPETIEMKLRQDIPSKYANLFRDLQLLEKGPNGLSDTEDSEDSELINNLPLTINFGDPLNNIDGKTEGILSEQETSIEDSETASLTQNNPLEPSLECPKCHKAYSSKNNARRHMKKCLSNNKEEKLKVKFPDFVCVFCDSSYSTFLSFKNHMNVTCQKKPGSIVGHLCDKCKVFIFKPSGTDHPCEPYFNCDQCTFKCYNENHFRQHYRLAHLNVGTLYCCEICGKTFDSKTRLGHHLVVHTKERSFLCTECGKGFGRKSVLDVHMSVHFSKNVPCNICGKIFAHSTLVRKHMAAQHPKDGVLTREPCPHCNSSFRSKFYLLKHIKQKHT